VCVCVCACVCVCDVCVCDVCACVCVCVYLKLTESQACVTHAPEENQSANDGQHVHDHVVVHHVA